jgi:ParB family transcriptional regulator, chromosome partitioning protein
MSEDMAQRDAIFDTSSNLAEIVELDLTQVRPDPNQPRQFFDEEDLEELASSIRQHGQLQPIMVRPDPEGERSYIIIGGERRYRAFERLKLERIQAVIRRVDERKARELALVENLQRVDLSPFEEATGYARLIDEFGLTQEQVAEQVGKSRTVVAGTLALNRLPQKVRDEARSTKLAKSKFIELAQLSDEKRQLDLWEKLKKGITIGEARREKQQVGGGRAGKQAKPSQDKQRVAETLQGYRQVAQKFERIDPGYFRTARRDYERLVEIHQRIGKVLDTVRELQEEEGADRASEGEASAS